MNGNDEDWAAVRPNEIPASPFNGRAGMNWWVGGVSSCYGQTFLLGAFYLCY